MSTNFSLIRRLGESIPAHMTPPRMMAINRDAPPKAKPFESQLVERIVAK
jgi:hypothetical protein